MTDKHLDLKAVDEKYQAWTNELQDMMKSGNVDLSRLQTILEQGNAEYKQLVEKLDELDAMCRSAGTM